MEWVLQWDGLALGALAIVLALSCRARERETARQLNAHDREREALVTTLRKRNDLLELTESVAGIGHWRLDLADDSLFWSENIFAIYGLPAGSPPSLENAILPFHPEDRDKVANHVETARETAQPYVFEARLLRPNGEVRQVEARGHPELNGDGKVIALYGMLADRTEAIALRQQALDDRDRAQAASRAKADFLAHMSHELRTPMNGVIGFTDLLLADDDLPQKVREKLGLIAESGRAMNQILGDILDLSKIEAGELSLTSEAVNTRGAVDQVIRSLDATARTKGLVLASHVADDVPKHIEGDGLRLRQILINLVGNAIKFTPTGTVAVSVRQRDNAIAFSVRDTGLGIPADRLDAIFGDFTQGDESVTRRFGGTGLGLAISRRLARQMGGTLKVRSVEGRGSTFTLTLPCRETTVAERPRRAAVPGHAPRSYRPLVLLAEDHDINRMLVEEMAEALGIELVSVKDGLEAGQAVDDARAAGRPFDLVLMDLQMPRVTGIEATRAIRASGLSPTDLPILALTANAFQDDIAAARDAGMQAHLAKPITLEVLQRGLNRWLPRKAQDGARKRKVAA